MGYQGKDLIKFFDIQSENFICSSTKRPFNNKLIIRSLLIFLKTLFLRPYLFLKVLRWVHTIYFICAYIEKKNIINIVSFTDYNLVPFYIKKILGKKKKLRLFVYKTPEEKIGAIILILMSISY